MDTAAPAPPARTSLDPIENLLRGAYVDGETGAAISIETRELAVADSLAGSEAALVRELDLGRRLAVVSDATTHQVLGKRIERALAGISSVTSIVLEREPHADEETVARIRAATADVTGFVAVGSGTLNDLTKYASALDGKPYAVFGTAPSMNGYTSRTASISRGGHKLTLPAHAPLGAFFDLGVLAAAPARMIRAGLGDSICRCTAQADWLLSHLLFGTPYRRLPFDLLASDEADLLANTTELLAGDLDVIRKLVRTLVLSGFGTAIVGSSAPASQAEHLVSHYVDMLAPPGRPNIFHGEQVGVSTLSIARLYERMFEVAPVLRPDTLTQADLCGHLGDDLATSAWPEFERKRLDRRRTEILNARLAIEWNTIRDHVSAVLLPATRIEAVLNAAGAPLTPSAIALERGFYEAALLHGREIRDRYTILDLAAQSGMLAAHLHEL